MKLSPLAAPVVLAALLAVVLCAPVTADEAEAPRVSVEVLEAGSGDAPNPGDKVTIDYILRLADGKEIGNTFARKRPFTFVVEEGQVIPGMLQAITQLKPGSRTRVTIPSALAYGKRGKPSRTKGKPAVVPPNTDIVYEITLREVIRRPALPKVDPDKAQKTDSGLTWWLLEPGSGDAPKGTQRARLSFAVWNENKKYVMSTHDRKRWIDGQVSELQLMDKSGGRPIQRERFLAEAAQLLKPGARAFFQVPAELAWRGETPHRLITPHRTTWWELKLLDVHDIPTFKVPPDAELTKTKSGLRYKLFRPGTGAAPRARSFVRVHYSGWMKDGRQFDSSYTRGYPQGFPVGRVVPGFKEAVMLLREGGEGVFVLPGAIAYGSGGNPRSNPPIPPNTDLVFHVELISVE